MAVQYQLTQLAWSAPGVSAVTVTITAPSGAVSTVAATSGSQQTPNEYSTWFTPQEVGDYTVVWAGSGGATRTDTVVVEAPASTVDLLTINDCYETLKIPVAQQPGPYDADMLFYARAATRVVEGIVGPIVPQTVTEVFDGGGPFAVLKWRPTSIVSITQNGVPATGWVPNFVSAIIYAGYFGAWWTPGIRNLRIVYTVGNGHTKENVVLGVREVFRQIWERSRTMGGAASGDMVMQGFAVPNAVYELLAAEPMLPGLA